MDVRPELRRGPAPLRQRLLLLLLGLGSWLCSCLLAPLLGLLLPAAAACGDALALLRGDCAGAERLPELPGLAQRGRDSRLLVELGKVCLAGARSLFRPLAALWDSLAGSVLGVGELPAAFLLSVCGRARAAAVRLWLHCQLAFRLLCSATVVFVSGYFLLYSLAVVSHSGAQGLGKVFVTFWDSLAGLIFGVADLLAALLARVSSGAIAVSMLLWWPCQMAFELLCSSTKGFVSICFLVSSLVKGLLSLCVMGSQYLSMLLAILWDLLASLLLGVTNVLVAVLAYQFRLLFILLWLPFQLALTLLSIATWVFTSIFSVGVCILELLLRIVFIIVLFIVIYLNQELLWELKGRVLGYSRRLQPVLGRLYQVAVLSLHRATTSQAWRRLVDWVLQVTDGNRRMNPRRQQRDAGQGPQPRPALSCAGGEQTLGEEPGTSGRRAATREQLNATAGSAEGASSHSPWALLKEQEERKKCVICQDQTKTVLLLPCRHLCLCQECTEVLLQQDIDQRNCPLCRQVILQTLNVYL